MLGGKKEIEKERKIQQQQEEQEQKIQCYCHQHFNKKIHFNRDTTTIPPPAAITMMIIIMIIILSLGEFRYNAKLISNNWNKKGLIIVINLKIDKLSLNKDHKGKL